MSETKKTQTSKNNSKTGAKNVSLSFRIDSGVIEHNNRDFVAKNVIKERMELNITYKKEELSKKYEELFGKAIEEYNAKQKRADRKIGNYLEHIQNSKQEKPFYEIVVQIGDKDECGIDTENGEIAKQMLDEYIREFEKRNPNMKVFNAVMHLDEATPHLHIDFIPICHSPNRGVPVRVSLKGALKEQGMAAESLRNSEWAVWAKSEKEKLSEILKKHNFGVQKKNVKHSHMEVDKYKEYAQSIQQMNEHINFLKQKPNEELTKEELSEIKNQNDFLRSEIQKRDEKIRILAKKAGAKFVTFEVYSPDKLAFIAAELERTNIQFVEESNALYIPDWAYKNCCAIAEKYVPQKSLGVHDEIKLDIDTLIYSCDNFSELLDKLRERNYEIKTGKYPAVKSPNAQRFVRLKTLGEEYLPQHIEKRIENRERFSNAVQKKSAAANETQKRFYAAITETIIAVQTVRIRPLKNNPQRIYSFENDKHINFLSEQLLTLRDFNINSREDIYNAAEKSQQKTNETLAKIKQLSDEIPTLKSDISELKFLFSDRQNSSDAMTNVRLAAAKETAEKYGISSAEEIETLETRLRLIPTHITSLKEEASQEQANLSRLSELVRTYEKIIEGNYIDNLIAAQKEQTKTKIKNDKII